MKSLRLKFIIPISSIIFFSLISAVLLISQISSSLLKKNAELEMDSKVLALNNVLNHYFNDCKIDISCWAELKQFRDFSVVPSDTALFRIVNGELKTLSRKYEVYQSINIVDLNGDVIASSESGKGKTERLSTGDKIVNLKERDYFKGAIEGKTVLGKAIISKVTGSPVLCISAPIKVNGKVTAVFYAAVDLKAFSETFVKSVTMGKSGYAYVINKDGLFVAHPNDSLLLSKKAVEKFPFLKTMTEKKDGLLSYKWNNKMKSVAYHQIDATGWITAVGVVNEEIYAAVNNLRIIGLSILLASNIVAFFLTKLLINQILKGINSVTEASMHLSQGDLQYKINFTNNDEIGHMANAFRTMQENLAQKAHLAQLVAEGDLTGELSVISEVDTLGVSLKKMVEKKSDVLRSIQEVAKSVDTGASQVSMLSQELSDGSVKSAIAIEEISSSINAIGQQSDVNALRAKEVSALMSDTSLVINNAGSDMNRLEEAMEKINSSSEEISKIIKVIDDIAFQTNLLALNAAVEAARAGAHGKGFAVVADEVRNLAGRSAKAASETAALIETAVKNARCGREITNDTRTVFSKIVRSVGDVSERVEKITSSSVEQSQAIEQIVTGIEQIEEVIHNNSASSEETAAASQELSALSEELKRQVSRFKVREVMQTDVSILSGRFVAK